MGALIRKVDCVSLPVPDLARAVEFYRDRLGHELVWRTPSAVGLRLPDSEAELVLHTEARPPAAELLVDAVPDAASRFVEAGGTLLSGPFDIRIGRCAVVSDPWGNVLVLLDTSRGPLRTDALGNVLELAGGATPPSDAAPPRADPRHACGTVPTARGDVGAGRDRSGSMRIRPFERGDEEAVISLWERCELTRPWNDPRKDIERKLRVQPELFLVGTAEDRVVATAMAGYDGHRGWVNYLAVDPAARASGLGTRILSEVERRLLALGCPKVNVQIRATNHGAVAFYERLGYAVDEVVSMGKRLARDD